MKKFIAPILCVGAFLCVYLLFAFINGDLYRYGRADSVVLHIDGHHYPRRLMKFIDACARLVMYLIFAAFFLATVALAYHLAFN